MKKILFLILFANGVYAQELPESLTLYLENENIDESELSYLHEVLETPLNLNDCSFDELLQLPFISRVEVKAIINYRKSKKAFRSVYELQAISSLKRNTIRLLIECVTVKSKSSVNKKMRHQWTALYHNFFENQLEFTDSTYVGSKNKNYLRYKGGGKSVNFGFLTEKDAGENPFDFNSFHLNLKKRNIQMFFGDYQLSLGQGLLQYQGFSFGKSSNVINTFKRGKTIRSHTSTRESHFYRGLAVEQKYKLWKLSSWFSYKTIDGNYDETLNVITSLSDIGLHRTNSEIENKNQLIQKTYGAKLNYEKRGLNTSIYFNNHYWEKPLKVLEDTLLNSFSLASDYSLTLNNMHFFGELSLAQDAVSYLSGATINLSKNLSYALLYRNYSPDYFSWESNAFGEQSNNRNEKGLYSAFNLEFLKKWNLSLYSDYYFFPKESYYSSTPLRGKDYCIQLSHKPSKTWNALTRLNYESKTIHQDDDFGLHSIIEVDHMKILAQLDFKINDISFKSRSVWSNKDTDWGYLIFHDLKYKSLESNWSFTFRYLLFDTPDYSTRIYVYEPDVLFSFSVPAFYGEGQRLVGLVKYKYNRNLTINFKIAQTIYFDNTPIRSGSIEGDRLTEFKLLVKYVM